MIKTIVISLMYILKFDTNGICACCEHSYVHGTLKQTLSFLPCLPPGWKVSILRAADLGSIPALALDISPGCVIPVT